MKTIFLAGVVLMLLGCANPLNRITAERYTAMGHEAAERGDYVLAEIAFSRATANADWGFLGPHVKAVTLLNLAVAKAYLGKTAEAEPIYLEALGLQKKNSIDDPLLLLRTQLYLADLYLTERRFDSGFPFVWQFVESKDDFGESRIWNRLCDAYSAELRNRGYDADALRLEQKKRRTEPNQSPQTTPVSAPR